MFCGYLKYSGCGVNLNYIHPRQPGQHYVSCRNKRAGNSLCSKTQHSGWVLYEKLFEEKIRGNLTEERFKKLSEKYEDEQAELTQHIRHMEKVVAEQQKHELNAKGFHRRVRKYTDIEMLIPKILREFIDKVVVHHREKQGKETV